MSFIYFLFLFNEGMFLLGNALGAGEEVSPLNLTCASMFKTTIVALGTTLFDPLFPSIWGVDIILSFY